MKGSSPSSPSSSASGSLGLPEVSPDAPEMRDTPVSSTMLVESRDRTWGACARARDGEEDIDRPGTFESRRLGGVVDDAWMREEELISSAN